MSFLGKIGKGLKSVAGFVGKVGSVAAPLVGNIPGVGTALATGIGAGSGLLKGVGAGKVKLSDILKGGAMGAAGSLASKAFSGAKLLGGGKGAAASVFQRGPLQSGKAMAESGGFGPPALEGAMTGGAKKGLLSRVGDFLGRDPQGIAELGLGAANVFQSQQAQGQANGLRKQALANITPPPREDLSSIFSNYGTPAQPYGRKPARRVALRSLQ